MGQLITGDLLGQLLDGLGLERHLRAAGDAALGALTAHQAGRYGVAMDRERVEVGLQVLQVQREVQDRRVADPPSALIFRRGRRCGPRPEQSRGAHRAETGQAGAAHEPAAVGAVLRAPADGVGHEFMVQEPPLSAVRLPVLRWEPITVYVHDSPFSLRGGDNSSETHRRNLCLDKQSASYPPSPENKHAARLLIIEPRSGQVGAMGRNLALTMLSTAMTGQIPHILSNLAFRYVRSVTPPCTSRYQCRRFLAVDRGKSPHHAPASSHHAQPEDRRRIRLRR